MNVNSFYDSFSDADIVILKEYFNRKKIRRNSSYFNIVFDLLHECNLCCIGCGTDTIYSEYNKKECLSVKEIEGICIKIRQFADETGKKVFINLGGGEPFLREDIEDIIEVIYNYFGDNSIGIDTNGTIDSSLYQLLKVADKLSYIGISVHGLKEYHNWWTGNRLVDAYEKSIHLVRELCKIDDIRPKIEVTSIATKKNLHNLPLLIRQLSSYRVENYSVHRAIPVGRMYYHMDLILDAMEYFTLFIELINESVKANINFHMHHSIENIHRTLLLNEDTFTNDKRGDRNSASAIGINVTGEVVFDAWSMVDNAKDMTCGNIVEDRRTLEGMLSDKGTYFNKACSLTDSSFRCYGCKRPCAGGSRVTAAMTEMSKNKHSIESIEEFLDLFRAIDPACPLYI